MPYCSSKQISCLLQMMHSLLLFMIAMTKKIQQTNKKTCVISTFVLLIRSLSILFCFVKLFLSLLIYFSDLVFFVQFLILLNKFKNLKMDTHYLLVCFSTFSLFISCLTGFRFQFKTEPRTHVFRYFILFSFISIPLT